MVADKQTEQVKPYIARIRSCKIRNVVRLYLEARELFRQYRKLLRKGNYLSFEKMREISDILYEVKEDLHLIYKRLLDPRKKKFEAARKYVPDEVELALMNNVGLLFHKIFVARELKYVLEHYVEESETFKVNQENLQTHLQRINLLFDEGLEILKEFISRNTDDFLLLTLLLEDPDATRKQFGQNAVRLVEQFGGGKGLDEIYFSVAQYYLKCGRHEQARRMLKNAVRNNSDHRAAAALLEEMKTVHKSA